MACPYFYPVERFDDHSWVKPPRLPLGDPCRGLCHSTLAPSAPGDATLREFCNLGYARGRCPQFPPESEADSVRFSVTADVDGIVQLVFILERDWAPLRFGTIEYRPATGLDDTVLDPVLARQARVFVENYRKRRTPADQHSPEMQISLSVTS